MWVGTSACAFHFASVCFFEHACASAHKKIMSVVVFEH